MAVIRITNAAVETAVAPLKTTLFWDDRLKGFGLKVEPSGSKTYLVQYRMGGRGSATRRFTIGRHGSPWTSAAARAEAERLLFSAASGTDPQTAAKERQRLEHELAFAPYAHRFLTDFGKRKWRPRTWSSAESNMRRHVIPILANKPLHAIKRAHLVAVFDRLPPNSPALPRNVFALLRKLFAWAVERGDLERSPFEGFKSPAAVGARERVLTDHELICILSATLDLGPPFELLVSLLMFTGQRRDEVASLEWQELDRISATWSIPGTRTKNKRTHQVPLSDPIVRAFDELASNVRWPKAGLVLSTNGTTPVSGFSRAKRRLDALAQKRNGGLPLAPWRLHDLRRSMATGLQRLGVRFEVTEALLNHVSGARSGIAGVYQRYEWTDEKRAAIEAWTAYLQALIDKSAVDASERVAGNA